MRIAPLHLALILVLAAFVFGARAHAMTFETVVGPDACAERICVLAEG
jgi:hypothetical protein